MSELLPGEVGLRIQVDGLIEGRDGFVRPPPVHVRASQQRTDTDAKRIEPPRGIELRDRFRVAARRHEAHRVRRARERVRGILVDRAAELSFRRSPRVVFGTQRVSERRACVRERAVERECP